MVGPADRRGQRPAGGGQPVAAVLDQHRDRRPSGSAPGRTRCTRHAAGCCAGRYRARRYRSWMRSARRESLPFCWVNCSAPIIKSVSLAATCGETARRCSCGAVVLMLARSGPLRLSTRYGCIITPLLAIAAATIAFCSGVTATSFCPMLDMPSAAASAIGPTVDSATSQRDRRRRAVQSEAPARCCGARRRRPGCPTRRRRCCTTARMPRAARRSAPLPHGVPP